MTTKPEHDKNNTQDTSDINLAVYIKEVKDVASVGHFFNGNQLRIKFAISREEMQQYSNEYINSVQARCDATRRNYLHLLK